MFWIVLSLIILYIFLTLPNLKRRKQLDKYKINYYHRGYFDNINIAENSINAFKKAIEYGTAIELDVHITKDKKLVVVHDNDLIRMTNHNLKIKDSNYDEIKGIKLLNTEDTIPLFEEVLKMVDSKVTLYIELKDETKDYRLLVDEVIKTIKEYEGDYILCSFNPLILGYLRNKYPRYLRGLIIENYHKTNNVNMLLGIILQSQLLNIIARPDLLSFRYTDVSKIKANLYHIINTPLLAWSIKDLGEYHKYKDMFDGCVIEGIKLE